MEYILGDSQRLACTFLYFSGHGRNWDLCRSIYSYAVPTGLWGL